ncbi:MAG: arsinothricin resistance N-acetyltransferase ArsN1 [Acidobacteriota bacterium]|nr:arsinothricin resistance N-acetyltransferase ArsN1 [Acidobacteriota bacterium]
MRVRAATRADAAAIAAIYNQGIGDGVATFETRLRTVDEITLWFDDVHPVVVVHEEDTVIAFGATSTYRSRACYAGIAETSVYVARENRTRGAGRMALAGLIEAAERAGYWKLVSRIFPENASSRALVRSLGFREVGVYEKHGRLDGIWRDVIVVERLLTINM